MILHIVKCESKYKFNPMDRLIVKCEMCESKYKFNPMDRLGTSIDAPPSWFVLFKAKDLPAQEVWHFCSNNCLYRWAVKDYPQEEK